MLHVLPRTVDTALQGGVPAAYVGFVARNFDRVVRAASACAFPGQLGRATAGELGLSAALYALAGYINGPREWPDAWEEWAGVARWKAKNLARDLLAQRRRAAVDSFDAACELESGETCGSPLLARASLETYHEQASQEARKARIAAVRYAISHVVDLMPGHNRARTRGIVRAVYQDGEALPKVAARFGVSGNHLFQILFRFREAFKANGRRYMAEYLAA